MGFASQNPIRSDVTHAHALWRRPEACITMYQQRGCRSLPRGRFRRARLRFLSYGQYIALCLLFYSLEACSSSQKVLLFGILENWILGYRRNELCPIFVLCLRVHAWVKSSSTPMSPIVCLIINGFVLCVTPSVSPTCIVLGALRCELVLAPSSSATRISSHISCKLGAVHSIFTLKA
ncbi:hypothetical protein BC834DRAFT_394380 [Gloeopeniophorella convolvens]|nr:hypothetical protein BC834DRAFT_394380 [Gloeopeniophorella convolvens]